MSQPFTLAMSSLIFLLLGSVYTALSFEVSASYPWFLIPLICGFLYALHVSTHPKFPRLFDTRLRMLIPYVSVIILLPGILGFPATFDAVIFKVLALLLTSFAIIRLVYDVHVQRYISGMSHLMILLSTGCGMALGYVLFYHGIMPFYASLTILWILMVASLVWIPGQEVHHLSRSESSVMIGLCAVIVMMRVVQHLLLSTALDADAVRLLCGLCYSGCLVYVTVRLHEYLKWLSIVWVIACVTNMAAPAVMETIAFPAMQWMGISMHYSTFIVWCGVIAFLSVACSRYDVMPHSDGEIRSYTNHVSGMTVLMGDGVVRDVCFYQEGSLPVLAGRYIKEGPLGGLLQSYHDEHGSCSIGVIGLGAGSFLSFAEKGDVVDVYESHTGLVHYTKQHDIYRMAQEKQGVTLAIKAGNPRKLLSECPSHAYDIMICDTAIDDTLPLYLITREAWLLYREKVKEDGVILLPLPAEQKKELLEHLMAIIPHLGYYGYTQRFIPEYSNIPGSEDEAVSRGLFASQTGTTSRHEDPESIPFTDHLVAWLHSLSSPEYPDWLHDCTWFACTRKEGILKEPWVAIPEDKESQHILTDRKVRYDTLKHTFM